MGGVLSLCSKSANGGDSGETAVVGHKKAEDTSAASEPGSNRSNGPLRTKDGTHEALRLLGSGAAADTWLFRDIKLSRPVAIKIFQRPMDYYPVTAVQREVLTQAELGPGHINLINVYELFLTPDTMGLVMEAAEGGSMTDYVSERRRKADPHGLVLLEDEVLYLFKQFVSAVAYCHRHQIAHRDLKLDNTLLDGSDPPIVKICDFGFARHFSAHFEKTASHLGTPEYMSPELLHKTAEGQHDSYDARRVDVWASGVLLLLCLCGAFPFDHAQRDTAPMEKVENDLWKQEVSRNWREAVKQRASALSSEVQDLLDQILKVDPESRITVEGIMQHPWYKKTLPGKYQDALDALAEQQRLIEKHVEEQRFDRSKVSKRSKEITKMVEDAGRPRAAKKAHVKPKHMLDMKHADLVSIDLTERSVVHGTPSGDIEVPAVVKERFDRDSVKGTVDDAFKSNPNLGEIVGGPSQSRGAIGGGHPSG